MFHGLVTRHSDTQFEVDDYEWAELDMSVPSHRPVSTLHSVQSVSVSEWWRGNITVLWLWGVGGCQCWSRQSRFIQEKIEETFFEYIILRRKQLQFRYWTFHCLPSVFCLGLVCLSWSVFACVLIFICLLWSSGKGRGEGNWKAMSEAYTKFGRHTTTTNHTPEVLLNIPYSQLSAKLPVIRLSGHQDIQSSCHPINLSSCHP